MRFFNTFFLYIFSAASLFGNGVDEGLKNIPPAEMAMMDSFFDYAIKLGHAGHVLYFQTKPVCSIAISLKAKSDVKFREGWYAFNNYKKLFPHENFLFNERKKIFPTDEVIHIYLINKNALLDCVNRNTRIFQKILKRKVDGTQFIKDLENGKQLLDLINKNEILHGILLGYGEDSSKLYAKRQMLGDKFKKFEKICIAFTSKKNDAIDIYPVAFVGSAKSEEAKKINDKFEQEWRLLWQIYLEKNQDSTRFFLDALCS